MSMSLFSGAGSDLYIIMEIIGYLIFTFIGSLLKEIFNTNSIEGYTFQAHRVISSTIAASAAAGAIRSMYMENYSYAVMVFVSITLGLLGFEIFKNLCSVKGIKKLISDFTKIFNMLTQLPTPNNDNKDESNSELSSNSSTGDDKSPFVPKIRIHPNKKNSDE